MLELWSQKGPCGPASSFQSWADCVQRGKLTQRHTANGLQAPDQTRSCSSCCRWRSTPVVPQALTFLAEVCLLRPYGRWFEAEVTCIQDQRKCGSSWDPSVGCDDVISEPTKCTLQKHDRFRFLQSYLKPEEQWHHFWLIKIAPVSPSKHYTRSSPHLPGREIPWRHAVWWDEPSPSPSWRTESHSGWMQEEQGCNSHQLLPECKRNSSTENEFTSTSNLTNIRRMEKAAPGDHLN